MKEVPAELERYIAQQKSALKESNNADFKPTSIASLKLVEQDSLADYERGLEVIAKISRKDLERCRKLYAVRYGAGLGTHTLRRARVNGVWGLFPSFVCLIEEVRSLALVFALVFE